MDKSDVIAARDEARRFLDRVEPVLDTFQWIDFKGVGGGYWRINDTRATSALKRASMDLTRALVKVRKS